MKENILKYEAEYHDKVDERRKARKNINELVADLYGSAGGYSLNLIEVKDKVVLDYGCGEGNNALKLLENGTKQVVGIDISKGAIHIARRDVSNPRVSFMVMSAEELAFLNESFDIIYGTGIIHHLNLAKTLKEIHRILKRGGIAIFMEPLGHNPFVNWYRMRTPKARTPYEHPLTVEDLAVISSRFKNVFQREFYLTVLFLIPLKKYIPKRIINLMLSFMSVIDRFLFTVFPFLRRYAWIVILKCEKDSK